MSKKYNKVIKLAFLLLSLVFLIYYGIISNPTGENIDLAARKTKKVVFIASTQSVGGKGIYQVYKEMKRLNIDVKIAMIPLFYENKKLTEGIDFDFAKKFDENDVVFPCGKSEPYQCKGIEDLKPDYIFSQMPYNPYAGSPLEPYFTNDYLKKIGKIAQIVYGPHIFHQMGMNNTNLPNLVDIIFVDSEVSKDIYIKYFNFHKDNVIVSGYQPYKDIRDKMQDTLAISKTTDHKETLLWLPRWQLSFRDRELYEGGSTFLNYHYYFYNLLKDNPDINLIIRPHYGLFLLRSKFLTQEDLMGIFNRFQELPNVTISYHQNTSLTEDIMKSDIIISDGSSALAEVVVANKPIIYLSNGSNNEFNSNSLSQQLKKEIYLAYDPLDIERYTDEIRTKKYKSEYSSEFKTMLDPVENPAQHIAEYVLSH